MAAKPAVDPHIRSRTAFIAVGGTKRNPTYKPVPWHLVEYAFTTGVTDGKVVQLWEPVDIDHASRCRETNKVVTRIEFVDEDRLYSQRADSQTPSNRGVNGGSAYRHPSRTL